MCRYRELGGVIRKPRTGAGGFRPGPSGKAAIGQHEIGHFVRESLKSQSSRSSVSAG